MAETFGSPSSSVKAKQKHSSLGAVEEGGKVGGSTPEGSIERVVGSVGLQDSLNKYEDHILTAVGLVGRNKKFRPMEGDVSQREAMDSQVKLLVGPDNMGIREAGPIAVETSHQLGAELFGPETNISLLGKDEIKVRAAVGKGGKEIKGRGRKKKQKKKKNLIVSKWNPLGGGQINLKSRQQCSSLSETKYYLDRDNSGDEDNDNQQRRDSDCSVTKPENRYSWFRRSG